MLDSESLHLLGHGSSRLKSYSAFRGADGGGNRRGESSGASSDVEVPPLMQRDSE
jgi:hypothetical protein